MVLYGDAPRNAYSHRFGGRHVPRMEIMRDHLRLDAVQARNALDHRAEVLQRLQRVEIADVRTHVRRAALRDGDGVLEVRANGENGVRRGHGERTGSGPHLARGRNSGARRPPAHRIVNAGHDRAIWTGRVGEPLSVMSASETPSRSARHSCCRVMTSGRRTYRGASGVAECRPA